MTKTIKSWQAVEQEVRRRIHSREWAPGEPIPNEADLALEFGCARATVNRALRALADSGLLDRRRKAGTRVALHPIRKAVLEIPVIRQEIEEKGLRYRYELVERTEKRASKAIMDRMDLVGDRSLLNVFAIHFANDRPYVAEDRWIDPAVVPGLSEAPLDRISANEWLLSNAPYTRSDIVISALCLTATQARQLGASAGQASFRIERITWDGDDAVTTVELRFAPGYSLGARF